MRQKIAISLGVVLLALLGWILTRVWSTSPDAWDLLRRAEEAEQRVSYVGSLRTVTHFRQQQVACRVKVYRQAPDRERMEYQSEPLAGLVTGCDEHGYWHYDPRSGLTLLPGSEAGAQDVSREELRRRNYRAEVTGIDWVAGRETYLLTLTPRHPGNPSRRLWVEARTGLILKQEHYDAEGVLATQTEFQEIDFQTPSDGTLFAPPGSGGTRSEAVEKPPWTRAQVEEEVGFPVQLPAYLPPGYELAGYEVCRCGCGCGMLSARIQYVDGLNTLSIFETDPAYESCLSSKGCELRETEAGPCLLADFGPAKSVMVLTTDPLFAVVGDLAEEQLARVAASLREEIQAGKG